MRKLLASLVFWVAMASSTVPRLWADGGAVVLHQEAGPLVITVFASPTPIRAGLTDLSVMIQRKDSLDPVLNAVISLVVWKGGEGNNSTTPFVANHDKAQNKLLYATTVDLSEAGEWNYSARIRDGSDDLKISGALTVAPAQPKLEEYWGYFALPPLCIALFGFHQLLKRRALDRHIGAAETSVAA